MHWRWRRRGVWVGLVRVRVRVWVLVEGCWVVLKVIVTLERSNFI